MKLISTDPSYGYKRIGSVSVSTHREVTAKVRAARKAARRWKEIGLDHRIKLVRALAKAFSKNKVHLSKIQSAEMGMRIAESEGEIDGAAHFLEWYSDHAHEALDPVVTFEDKKERHEARREPRGVLAVIVPWNYPFANFVWQCGQNLLAGNTIVFKHSEETPLCGKAIEKLVREAGIPKGVFEEVYGDGKVGAMLAHSDVDGICFTGSTKVGESLYLSGAKRLLPVHLELGGSSPGIVFSDADIKQSAEWIYNYRFTGCGQQCKAIKRLIVHESVFDRVVTLLMQRISKVRVGPADDRMASLGPLVAERQVKLLEEQVSDAKQKGARILVGGKRPDGLQGAYYEPTLITKIKPIMRVWREEVFGPVLSIVPFKTEEQALTLANDTDYGLGAFVFTKNATRFERVAKRLDSGMVSMNHTNFVRACNPFGGYKRSGLGREHGIFGFHDATQLKLVSFPKI